MRYSTYINNQKCLEWQLNAAQGALFDLINQAQSWSETIVQDGEVYYWMSRHEVIKQLPLFYSKPDTVYRHFIVLADKGLIIYLKQGKKDLVRLTEKGKSWNEFNPNMALQNSEINPNNYQNSEMDPKNNAKLGNKSEKTRKQIRKNSEINPTYNIKNNNIKNNNNITPEQSPENLSFNSKSAQLKILKDFGLDDKLASEYYAIRKSKNLVITETAMAKLEKIASKGNYSFKDAIKISVENCWGGFNPAWVKNQNNTQPGEHLDLPTAQELSSKYFTLKNKQKIEFKNKFEYWLLRVICDEAQKKLALDFEVEKIIQIELSRMARYISKGKEIPEIDKNNLNIFKAY